MLHDHEAEIVQFRILSFNINAFALQRDDWMVSKTI